MPRHPIRRVHAPLLIICERPVLPTRPRTALNVLRSLNANLCFTRPQVRASVIAHCRIRAERWNLHRRAVLHAKLISERERVRLMLLPSSGRTVQRNAIPTLPRRFPQGPCDDAVIVRTDNERASGIEKREARVPAARWPRVHKAEVCARLQRQYCARVVTLRNGREALVGVRCVA